MVKTKKQKLTTHKKMLSFTSHLPEWRKTYWWFFALLLIPVFMIIQPIVGAYVDAEHLRSKLERVDRQLSAVYTILDNSSELYAGDNLMMKRCSRDYYRDYHGLSRFTECGTYLEITIPKGDVQHIANILSSVGFLDVQIAQNGGSDTGRIDFTSSDHVTCHDYWQPDPSTTSEKSFAKHSVYCVTETPDYMKGYFADDNIAPN